MSNGLQLFLALLRIAAGLSILGPGLQKLSWFRHPGLQHVLATWAYQWGVPGGEIGLGAAVSVVLFPLLAVLVAGTLLLIRRPE